MSSSSKAPFSFHCVICIEPFNFDDRFPVVLPCGHTYLCALCAARLQRCMECRTSLFYSPSTGGAGFPPSPPPPPPSPMSPYSTRLNSTASRYGYGNNARGGHAPPVRAEKVRLPLPKNLVLLDLMQAAEGPDKADETIPSGEWSKEEKAQLGADAGGRGEDNDTKENEERTQSAGDDCESRDTNSPEYARNLSASVHLLDNDTEEGYESGDDDERVLDSIRGAVCDYGTYAIRERDGLFILPHHPMRKGQDDEELLRELDRMPSGDKSPSAERSKRGRLHTGEETPEGVQLRKVTYGYRIQVVSNREGVAKLARGAGYVVADSEQLVKVGPPTDRACTLEGMIHKATASLGQLNSSVQTLSEQRSKLVAQLKRALLADIDGCGAIQPPLQGEDDEDGSRSEAIEKRESQDTGHEEGSNDGVKLSPSETIRHGESDGDISLPPLELSRNSPPTVIAHQLQLPELTKEHGSDRRCAHSADATDPSARAGFTTILDSCSDSGRVSLSSVPEPPSRQVASIASRSIDLGCSGFFGDRYLSEGDDTENDRNMAIEMGYEEAVRLVSGGAVAGNSQNNRTAPNPISLVPRRSAPLLEELGGFHVVNFRTGLSGHMGLTRSDRDRRPLVPPRNEIRQMGEHRGISSIKRIRPKPSSPGSPRLGMKTSW